MRGVDTFTESLFTMRRLDDFVSNNYLLFPVCQRRLNIDSPVAAAHFSCTTGLTR